MLTLEGGPSGLRRDAEEALQLARAEPARVWALAEGGVDWKPRHGDPETAVIAELALGVAACELHELERARAHLLRAREDAAAAALDTLAAEADITLALVLVHAGEFDAALAQLERTMVCRSSPLAVRVECQRAMILQRLGRWDEALEAYRRGLTGMRRTGDRMGEARLLSNRGMVHAYAGRFDAAWSDLRRAARLHGQLGNELEGAYVRHNMGFVAARQGDIPAALRAYEAAASTMARLGVAQPSALLDYCETLLRANLVTEARQVGERAVAQLVDAGMESDLAEGRLLLAEVALVAGDLDNAEHGAVLAQFAFLAQARQSWEVMARYTWLRVRWARGDRTEETMLAAQRLAADLRRSGWSASAAHARILAARIALERGDIELAESELRAEARHRRRAPAAMRIQAWHAEALLRRSRGDRRGAQSALHAGMRALSGYRAALGATELRVNAGTHAYELGRLAVQIALEGGEAERVLAWAERSRAWTIRLAPVRPPADEELAKRLAELRALDQTLEEAARGGLDTAALLRRKAMLEDAVRRRSWYASGHGAGELSPPSPKELRRALGDRVLVEYVESDGVLHAVTVADGRSRLSRIGAACDVEVEVDSLRFAVERLTSGRGSRGSPEVMARTVAHAAARLDRALLGSLRPKVDRRPLVIVPSGMLHQLPWAVLPSCRGRSVSVAPSAAAWLHAAAQLGTGEDRTVLAAGPGLAHAREELAELGRIYPRATRLAGRSATGRALTEALEGAHLAHVIAHGSFRADNPLFSSLRLADGPLTVYELERLGHPPHRIVLSACNAGLSAVRPDNGLLGLSAALLALGTRTLVASLLAVGDSETRRLMVDFHRLLADGVEAPAALARAQAMTDEGDARALASAASFVCLGA